MSALEIQGHSIVRGNFIEEIEFKFGLLNVMRIGQTHLGTVLVDNKKLRKYATENLLEIHIYLH